MFYLYYCAQQRIKNIENEQDKNNVNKDVEGIVIEQCSLLQCKCRTCGTYNRSAQNPSVPDGPDSAHNNVWSVSREINQVYGPPPTYQWPTHDQHISLDSFSLRPTYQNFVAPPTTMPNDTGGAKIAPPPYSEVDLPAYDDVVATESQHVYETIPAVVGRTQIS